MDEKMLDEMWKNIAENYNENFVKEEFRKVLKDPGSERACAYTIALGCHKLKEDEAKDEKRKTFAASACSDSTHQPNNVDDMEDVNFEYFKERAEQLYRRENDEEDELKK